jgi:hypothetical protein
LRLCLIALSTTAIGVTGIHLLTTPTIALGMMTVIRLDALAPVTFHMM